GGHNGLKSIDALMGADYERVRIGIGRSMHKGESAVTGHVLGEFNAEEKEGLEKILDYCENALNELIKNDIDAVSQQFSTKKGIL
ncbi:aminoacyl-tRNA hydrolase, partial [uncultured Campylobacter sp.]|uniref:aminoacyl-tRNA hydrolase n=1 Tax=uncultured Campylobacter sp. TaxID=218934 RepID=UPI0026300DB8